MALEADPSLVYRPYSIEDIPFIYSSWGSSYYKGSGAHKQISPTEFHALHRSAIDHFFSRSTATIIVVNHVDEPSVILGWIAVEIFESKLVIHYVYVKSLFRRQGFLWNLIDRIDLQKPILYTHLTDRFSKIMARNPSKYKRFTYLPLT